MDSMFKTPDDIKQFVLSTLDKASGIDWETVGKYTDADIQELLETAKERVSIFERGYTTLTALNDVTLAPVIDSVMFGLADAYAAEHTFSTIVSIKDTVNG
jgi:hypothetical protein